MSDTNQTPHLSTYTIAQSERGWDVCGYDNKGSILPMDSYPNAYKAAARLLQLMEINLPVTPQNWPERYCIGELPNE